VPVVSVASSLPPSAPSRCYLLAPCRTQLQDVSFTFLATPISSPRETAVSVLRLSRFQHRASSGEGSWDNHSQIRHDVTYLWPRARCLRDLRCSRLVERPEILFWHVPRTRLGENLQNSFYSLSVIDQVGDYRHRRCGAHGGHIPLAFASCRLCRSKQLPESKCVSRLFSATVTASRCHTPGICRLSPLILVDRQACQSGEGAS